MSLALRLLPVAALAFLVAMPAGNAQYTFSATGTAEAEEVVLKAFLSRHPDPDFTMWYTMVLYERTPTIQDPFHVDQLELRRFQITDNFNEAADPLATSFPFWAQSADANVTFDFSGVQVSRTVTGTGHYQQYELKLTAELFGI